MKHLLLTTIAAVVLVGCGESQQLSSPAEAKPEPPIAKAPDISIHFAAGKGNIEAVKQHLAAGTDVNAKGRNGWAPLHEAASGGHNEIAELLIAELLIASAADVNAQDVGGYTPLDYAAGETADLLRKHGGKTSIWLRAGESIHVATSAGHIEAVKQHLAAGADVNAKDNNGMAPLHHAALRVHKEIVELLIDKGANVNARNEDGETPLDWAEDETADLIRKHGGKTKKELAAEGK